MTGGKDYTTLLLEQIREQNKAVLEAVGDMQRQVAFVPPLREDNQKLKEADVAFKLAIRDLSFMVNNHEGRITKLEQA